MDEYVRRFELAMSRWPEGRRFVEAGGVPGCRVPVGTLAELACWFYRADPEAGQRGHDPRWREGMRADGLGRVGGVVRLSPERAVEILREEDESYSPD